MGQLAVFWDRDDTLIPDPGYISDPDQVQLLPGAAEAFRRLSQAGYENIITTNQSGIARGLLDEPTLEKIHSRLHDLFAGADASIDAIYYCPYFAGEEAVVKAYCQDSDLRKPKPGMLLKASLERNIDLVSSWMIGDSLHDAQAGRAAGCRTVLIQKDSSADPELDESRYVDYVVKSLEEAVDIVLKQTQNKQNDEATETQKESHTVLQEILMFLRMIDRRAQTEDFSLTRLAGAVVQLLAIAALVWAVFAVIRGEAYGVQIVRLMFSLVLQLIALTFFVLSAKK